MKKAMSTNSKLEVVIEDDLNISSMYFIENERNKMTIGYTAGVYDMFHIGHLNILRNAKQKCDFLIVAVSTDNVVEQNKHKKPMIPFAERKAIVESIRYVDRVIEQTEYSIEGKIRAAQENNIQVMFVGDDWKGTDKWNTIESRLKEIGIRVEYLPHTGGISSTILRERINEK